MSVAPLPVDPDAFLDHHWQREPLFISGAMTDFVPPADADELAGLALESDIDARIVTRDGEHWRGYSGPFSIKDLQREGPWALLVHGVDRYWDEAADLFDAVPFIPHWRRDDVLMSYASDGGGAGPHFDLYDVFIIQGEGEREWELGQHCDVSTPLQDSPSLRLLRDFEPRSRYLLGTGDVLYIPPGVAHRGTSRGESTSFSLGFRAPRLADLLARRTDNRLEGLADWQLLNDPGRPRAGRPGEITGADLDAARTQLEALLDGDDGRWFGEVLTEGGVDHNRGENSDSVSLPARGDCVLIAEPGARLAWQETDSDIVVFAAGASRPWDGSLRAAVETLCAGAPLSVEGDCEELRELLQWLVDQGTVTAYDSLD